MKKLVTGYTEIETDDEEYEVTPVVLAGKWTENDTIVNNAEDYEHVEAFDFTLVAITNNQLIYTFENRKFRRLLIMLKAAASTTSYDWHLEVSGTTGNGGILGPTGTKTWYKDAIATTNSQIYYGEIPYGMDLLLEGDNNHATLAIVLTCEFWLYDPVR